MKESSNIIIDNSSDNKKKKKEKQNSINILYIINLIIINWPQKLKNRQIYINYVPKNIQRNKY